MSDVFALILFAIYALIGIAPLAYLIAMFISLLWDDYKEIKERREHKETP